MEAADVPQTRDVMAFGQEVGRVLSDGRVVGRAEPFAKVFPSSRGVKRAVGLLAWGVLEDIALDATIDENGRLVAETNARRIAANVGLSRNTVQKHLARLREFGFVLHEEVRHDDSGRYEVSRYVIDPGACIERFTATPQPPSMGRESPPRSDDVADVGNQVAGQVADVARTRAPVAVAPSEVALARQPAGNPSTPGTAEPLANEDGGSAREAAERPRNPVPQPAATGDRRPVAQDVGHGDPAVAQSVGHGGRPVAQSTGTRTLRQKEHRDVDVLQEQHATSARDELTARLFAAGVVGPVAVDLVANHDAVQTRDALDAVELRRADNPAGWLVRAVSDGWDVAGDAATVRARRARQAGEQHDQREQASRAGAEVRVAARLDAWARAVSAALDDDQLAAALAATTPVGGVGRRSVGLSRTQLLAWAITAAARDAHRPLADVLTEALTDGSDGRCGVPAAMDDAPEAPATPTTEDVADLTARIRRTLRRDADRGAPPTTVVDR